MNIKLHSALIAISIVGSLSAQAQIATNSQDCLNAFQGAYSRASALLKSGEFPASVPSGLTRRDEFSTILESKDPSHLTAPNGVVELKHYANISRFYNVVGGQKSQVGAIGSADIDGGIVMGGEVVISLEDKSKSDSKITFQESRNGCDPRSSATNTNLSIESKSLSSRCHISYNLVGNCYSRHNLVELSSIPACNAQLDGFLTKFKNTPSLCK